MNQSFIKTNYIIGLALILSASVNAKDVDFSKNTATVSSVTGKFNDEVKEVELKAKKNLVELMDKYCDEEIRIFCPSSSDSYLCLKENYRLITGQCKELISKEFGRGIFYNRLTIHDLKLTKDSVLLKTEKRNDFTLTTYRSKNEFDYRDITFRKEKVQVRNYLDYNYEGQYVIYSGYPKSIFRDSANILYNPHFQKTPFFFDDKGFVTVGSLGQDYEYKTHAFLEKGTIVAFDKDRKLIRGILKSTVRYGRCQFLRGQEISEKDFEKCEK